VIISIQIPNLFYYHRQMLNSSKENQIDLQKTTINFRTDGIVVIQIKEKQVTYLEDVKDIQKTIKITGGEKSYPVLILAGKYSYLDLKLENLQQNRILLQQMQL